MASQLYVNGLAGLLSPSAIRTYRQSGVVVARNFLSSADLAALFSACREVALARGSCIFPAMDEEHRGRVDFDAKMVPRPMANLAAQDPPPEVAAQQREQDAAGALERRYQRVHLRCRDGRQVDRVYERLAAQRERYMRVKGVANHATEEEERAGRMSAGRLRALGERHAYEDVRRSFEAYRESGRMELEVRRDCHIDRALEHLLGWAKCWCRAWPGAPALQRLVCGGPVGRMVGEAAAALAGDVVVRLFDDAVHDQLAFANGTPFHFAGSSTNYRHAGSMTVSIGLAEAQAGALVVPGSHRVMREFTDDGQDVQRVSTAGVFDAGKALRHIAALRELPVVELPPLEPGSAMFLSDYTVTALAPNFSGVAMDYAPPSARAVVGPHRYAMMLMPDRCVFDGRRNSWASKDTHGPLYKYEAGQMLVDDAVFPVLHRALDIE